MNLRDKLRAISTSSGPAAASQAKAAPLDCKHLAVYRPLSEFPGAFALKRETLSLMSSIPLPEKLDPKRILYLDTETTGLAGTGTVAFLVGMGYLTDSRFEVHQFLMRDYPEEPFLLQHVANGLGKFDLLCTFNGASFDVPQLETRFTMNRMSRDCLALPHLDLLHLARRLWKLRLGRCNLSRLEEAILGKPRQQDIPGSEVPKRYFEYLKTKDEKLLQEVLDHNAQDIASLCVLLCHMAHLYEHPEELAFGEDAFAMGKALEKTHHPQEARHCYRLACKGRSHSAAAGALAQNLRRSGQKGEAARVWQGMTEAGLGGTEPWIELSKYYEHVKKDYAKALYFARKALAAQTNYEFLRNETVQTAQNAVQYRCERLLRKLKE